MQTSTGRTPFEINFGLDPVLPIDALVPVPPEPNAYANRVEELQATRGEVAERIRLAQQRQKLYYDRRRGPTQVFDPGDLVIVRRKAAKRGIPRKLQPRYVGPFEIVRQLSATTYEVRNLPQNWSRGRIHFFPAHTCQLKPPVAQPEEAGQHSGAGGGRPQRTRVLPAALREYVLDLSGRRRPRGR